MRRILVPLLLLLFATAASASPIEAGVWLGLSSHPDGNQAPPAYGLRLDGLNGDSTAEFTFDFNHIASEMALFYDDEANTLRIRGLSWGGEDVGTTYADGGSLYQIDFLYENVRDLGSTLEVLPPAADSDFAATYSYGLNRGSITDIDAGVTHNLVDFAGSHNYTFRCAESHRRAATSCYGWLNHSGSRGGIAQHEYASDWLFTVGEPTQAIPEPSAALLFGLGSALCGTRIRRRPNTIA